MGNPLEELAKELEQNFSKDEIINALDKSIDNLNKTNVLNNEDLINGNVYYQVYGEHCELLDEDGDDMGIYGDRYIVDIVKVHLDENGEVDDVETIEGFIDELFIDEDGKATWESEFENGESTSFTNGIWYEGYFNSLDDARNYIKNLIK